MRILFALVLIVASVWVLESARSQVTVSSFKIGETPVTAFTGPDAEGPPIIVAHGFAGSSQMMQGYALPLAQAGYRVYVFDFLGHGRHSVPMSGDVTAVDGTTRLLVEQTEAVIDAVAANGDTFALLGHSMATDVLIRVSKRREAVTPMVLLSAFSEEIDGESPENLLLIVGALEAGLRDFALDVVRMVDADATEGETVSRGGVLRRAIAAPAIEHVSILHSRVGTSEALDWLDQTFQRTSDFALLPTGPAIVGLLAGIVILFTGFARMLPEQPVQNADLTRRQLLFVVALPALATPPLAVTFQSGLMPVLVADYLALHLGIYGALQLALIVAWRVPLGPFSPSAFGLLLAGSVLFGFALNRYAANFLPTDDRFWIIAVIAFGSVLFFLADARLSHRASLLRRLGLHAAFLLSLLGAVALDFEGLFFLLMIAPVILLFYVAFGTMGHAASTRSGPLAPGLALGLILAWSLGVSFPLFNT